MLACVGVAYGVGRPSARLRALCFLVVVRRPPDLNGDKYRDLVVCARSRKERERCRGDGCTQLQGMQSRQDVQDVMSVEGGPQAQKKDKDAGFV